MPALHLVRLPIWKYDQKIRSDNTVTFVVCTSFTVQDRIAWSISLFRRNCWTSRIKKLAQPIESGPPWRVQPHQAAMRVLHVSFPSPKSHRRLKPLSNSIFRLSLYFLLDFWLTGSDLDSEHRLHTFDAHSRCYCRSTR